MLATCAGSALSANIPPASLFASSGPPFIFSHTFSPQEWLLDNAADEPIVVEQLQRPVVPGLPDEVANGGAAVFLAVAFVASPLVSAATKGPKIGTRPRQGFRQKEYFTVSSPLALQDIEFLQASSSVRIKRASDTSLEGSNDVDEMDASAARIATKLRRRPTALRTREYAYNYSMSGHYRYSSTNIAHKRTTHAKKSRSLRLTLLRGKATLAYEQQQESAAAKNGQETCWVQ